MSAVAQRSASVVLTPRGDVCCQDAGAELARDASILDMKDNQSIVVHNSGVSTIALTRIGPIVMRDTFTIPASGPQKLLDVGADADAVADVDAYHHGRVLSTTHTLTHLAHRTLTLSSPLLCPP